MQVDGAIVSPEGTLRDDGGGWVRTYGGTGWYNQTYGGGWYMTDTTYLRAYNNKSIYTTGLIHSGGLSSAVSANTDMTWSGSSLVFRFAGYTGLVINATTGINFYTSLGMNGNGLSGVSTLAASNATLGGLSVTGNTSVGTINLNGLVRISGLSSSAGSHSVCWSNSSFTLTKSGNCGSSDRRLKENIAPIASGLAEIIKLNPVTFEWKDKEGRGEGTKLGLIAQDVKEVFPEVITGTGTGVNGDWYGIDYNALAAPMIKAIQELQAENDELRNELEELRTMIENKN
jgi:hypothetical protein